MDNPFEIIGVETLKRLRDAGFVIFVAPMAAAFEQPKPEVPAPTPVDIARAYRRIVNHLLTATTFDTSAHATLVGTVFQVLTQITGGDGRLDEHGPGWTIEIDTVTQDTIRVPVDVIAEQHVSVFVYKHGCRIPMARVHALSREEGVVGLVVVTTDQTASIPDEVNGKPVVIVSVR